MKLANPMTGKQRKILYYAGIGLAAFGMLLVILAVASAVLRGGAAPRMIPLAVRAISGVGLTALGFVSIAIGSQGLPGSAIDMDVEFASDVRHPRFDPEPHETDDPLTAATAATVDATSNLPQAGPGELVCHWCHAANDDQARYCDQCGMRF